jgi:DNA-binding MarR family transcriptional regulator
MNFEIKHPDMRGAEALHRLDDFLPYKLALLSSSLNSAFEATISRQHGIGLTDWRILATIGQYGSMTAKQIGERGRMHKTKVSRAVATLEARRLLTRKTNRDDMREAFITLTEGGRRLYQAIVPVAEEFGLALTAKIDGADLLTVERVVDQLLAQTDRTPIEA